MQRFGRVLHLRDGMEETYEKLHANVWPDVLKAISSSGISNYSIFRYQKWLFSYFELSDDLSMDDASQIFKHNDACQKWEAIMHDFQEPLPESQENLWWVPMREVWHFPKDPPQQTGIAR